MRIKVLPYVTVDVDDRLRTRLRSTAERMRLNVRAYLLSAADDVDTAGDRVRGRFAAAVDRVDDAVGKVTDRLGADHAGAHDDSDVRREAG
ncbi:MAG: hypothetical protein QOJ67_4246 [Acidimicrobiaceae bacterium]|jgi:arylsulfatase A-like enzyme